MSCTTCEAMQRAAEALAKNNEELAAAKKELDEAEAKFARVGEARQKIREEWRKAAHAQRERFPVPE